MNIEESVEATWLPSLTIALSLRHTYMTADRGCVPLDIRFEPRRWDVPEVGKLQRHNHVAMRKPNKTRSRLDAYLNDLLLRDPARQSTPPTSDRVRYLMSLMSVEQLGSYDEALTRGQSLAVATSDNEVRYIRA